MEVKLLKRFFKRKFKMTEATIVMFLIFGGICSQAETITNIVNNDTIINQNSDFSWQKLYYKYNGFLSKRDSSIKYENNGTISGKIKLTEVQNNDSKIFIKNSGNGITFVNKHDEKPMKLNLINNGIITGSFFVTPSTSKNILNSKPILANGNGILYTTAIPKNSELHLVNQVLIEGQNNIDTASLTSNTKINQNGNGVIFYANLGQNENLPASSIVNNGSIKGNNIIKTDLNGSKNGNGIYSASAIFEINNNGIISGKNISNNNTFDLSGNGIAFVPNKQNLKSSLSVKNNGVISGYNQYNNSTSNIFSENQHHRNGNGIIGKIQNVENKGVIYGSKHAFVGESNTYAPINNYGIISETDKSLCVNIKNYGIYISSDNNVKEIKINGSKNLDIGMSVLNGTENGELSSKSITTVANDKNIFVNSSNLTSKQHIIINGIGKDGALKVNTNLSLQQAIINGNETAIKINQDNSFTGDSIIINSSGYNPVAIKGDNTANTIVLKGKTIINGDINLGAGSDSLTIASGVKINGDINAKNPKSRVKRTTTNVENDTLNLGLGNDYVNITGDINGFNNLNIDGNVVLHTNSKVTGSNNIDIGKNGKLIVKLGEKDEKNIIKNALSNVDGNINITDGGALELGLTGKEGQSETIFLNNLITINSNNITTNDIFYNSNLDNNKITIIRNNNLDFLAPSLNNIYSVSSKNNKIFEKLKNMVGDIDKYSMSEQMNNTNTILKSIYEATPYAHSLKVARDNLKIFEKNISFFTLQPKENEWLAQGRAIYSHNSNKTNGIDNIVEAKTNQLGGVATLEYGLNPKSSVGFIFGGNKSTTKIQESKIEGDTIYIGGFAKTQIDNFKLSSGAGYQYTSADATRKITTYKTFENKKDYDINGLNLFVESSYLINLNNNWKFEPKVRLSYYYINQDSINEGTNDYLTLNVNSIKNNTTDLNVGFNLIKEIDLKSGRLNNIFSFNTIRTFGDNDNKFTAYFNGDNNSFDIKGSKIPNLSFVFGYNLEFEKTNGMIYSTGIDLDVAKDNRNLNLNLGVGYRF